VKAGAEFERKFEGLVAFVELDGFANVIDHDAAGVAFGQVLLELLTNAGFDGAVDVFVESFEQVVAVHKRFLVATDPTARKGLQELFMAMRGRGLRGIAKGACQALAEHEAGAHETDFYVCGGDLQGLGGFLGGKLFHIAEDEDEAVFFVEFGEGLIEEGADFLAVGQIGDVLLPRGDEFGMGGCFLDGFKSDGGMSAFLAEEFEGGVSGDAHEPGAEGRVGAEVGEMLEGGEEGVLDDFLGIVGVADHAEGEFVDLAFVAGDEGVEGGEVAGTGAGDEVAVGIGLRCEQGFRHDAQDRRGGRFGQQGPPADVVTSRGVEGSVGEENVSHATNWSCSYRHGAGRCRPGAPCACPGASGRGVRRRHPCHGRRSNRGNSRIRA